MKLTDQKYFEIGCGGAIKEMDDFPTVEACLNLKILGITQEEKQSKIMIELENGKKLFIEAKNEVVTQCLGKIIAVIQRDYIGKNLKSIIEKNFCLAEKLN